MDEGNIKVIIRWARVDGGLGSLIITSRTLGRWLLVKVSWVSEKFWWVSEGVEK